jgi:hypothetical protein
MRYAWEFEQQPGEGTLWYVDEGISDLCRHDNLINVAVVFDRGASRPAPKEKFRRDTRITPNNYLGEHPA